MKRRAFEREEEYGPYSIEEMADALDRVWDEIAGDIFEAQCYGTKKKKHEIRLSRATVIDVTLDQGHHRADGHYEGANGPWGALRQFYKYQYFYFGKDPKEKRQAALEKRTRLAVVEKAFPKDVRSYFY
jgi:hypothetical protein